VLVEIDVLADPLAPWRPFVVSAKPVRLRAIQVSIRNISLKATWLSTASRAASLLTVAA
jgi:hypothetical protein